MITNDPKEIEILRRGGKILASVLDLVVREARPGISAKNLDKLAEKAIYNAKAIPSFKNYRAAKNDAPFPASLCVSVNDEVVHGIPTADKILKDGDIVGLDLGLQYQGLFTDMAVTVLVGSVDEKSRKLVATAKKSLEKAIEVIVPGKFTGDIGFAIESEAKRNGFSVVRDLVGHGVGKSVHEDPEIPCFGKPGKGVRLTEGMVIAVEPMINAGDYKIAIEDDKWTIKTLDGSRSAHAEHTLLITKNGCEILTQI